MAELDYDHTIHNASQRDMDRALLVRFFLQAIQNDEKSEKEGRPIYEDTEMIEIRVRGDKDNIVIRPMRPDDKKRFRDQWQDHMDGEHRKETGTPLSKWPSMSVSQVAEMQHLGFFTVENLADAKDSIVMAIPGLLTLKRKAIAFLEFAKGTAPIEQLSAKIDEKDNTIQTMQAQMSAMQEKMDKLLSEKSKEKGPEQSAEVKSVVAAAKRRE